MTKSQEEQIRDAVRVAAEEMQRPAPADTVVEAEISAETPLTERYDSGLHALFDVATGALAEDDRIEEIATRDVVSVQDVEGIEILATRDVMSVELDAHEASLLDDDVPHAGDAPVDVLTRDIIREDH